MAVILGYSEGAAAAASFLHEELCLFNSTDAENQTAKNIKAAILINGIFVGSTSGYIDGSHPNINSMDPMDKYLHDLTAFASYHLVYIDESGCDKRVGFRKTGWSPVGTTPVQTGRFHRGQRYHILPAYTQDGILLARIFQGSTDGEVFEDFLGELLQWCGRWPQPQSVLVMDNASFHRSDRVEELCAKGHFRHSRVTVETI